MSSRVFNRSTGEEMSRTSLLGRTIAIVALSLFATAEIQALSREVTGEEQNSPSSKRKDSFGAMLLLSDKPEDFFQAWDQPTIVIELPTTDLVKRGVPIFAFVVFYGCTPDAAGLCDASVDFTVLKPDGSEYASFKDKELWKNKPATKQSFIELSVDYIGTTIEPKDPLGQYQVRAAARDNNANISLELIQEFTAIKADEAPNLEAMRAKAEQGDGEAQFELGWMYDNGKGVPKNDAEAVKWYRKAGENGHPIAQLSLGLMYGVGREVPQNHVQSYAWLNLSALDGNETAKIIQNDLVKRMTADQLAEAKKLAREYVERLNKR